MVLSDKVKEDWLIAVEDLQIEDAKTKFAARMRKALPGAEKTALIVTSKDEAAMIRAAQNLAKTETIGVGSLNVRDLVKYQYVIASKAALDQINEIYA
jgi:large subunit ribosomal protein L4